MAEESKAFEQFPVENPSSDNAVNKDGFVGVDPVYQNFANKTDAPLAAGKGDEKALEEKHKKNLDGERGVPNVQLAAIAGGAPYIAGATGMEPAEEPAEDAGKHAAADADAK